MFDECSDIHCWRIPDENLFPAALEMGDKLMVLECIELVDEWSNDCLDRMERNSSRIHCKDL